MAPINAEALDKKVIVTESLVAEGETRFPFAQVVPHMLNIVKGEVRSKQEGVNPDDLYQILLEETAIDDAAKAFNPDRYASNKPRALVSFFNFVRELSVHALDNVSTVLTGQELERLRKLRETLAQADVDKPKDLLFVLSVADIIVPNLIQDCNYAKNSQQTGSKTTGGADYGLAAGRPEINQLCVDFRGIEKGLGLIRRLLDVEN